MWAYVVRMTKLLTTVEVAGLLGVDRSRVTRMVSSGTLVPAQQLPSRVGALLFDPESVAAVAAERAEKAAARAARAAELARRAAVTS